MPTAGASLAVLCLWVVSCVALAGEAPMAALTSGEFQWQVSEPLFAPPDTPPDAYYGIKDPSVVFFQGRWHLFCTIRRKEPGTRIEHLSFPDWAKTGEAQRTMLTMHNDHFGAPQAFYFTPHKKWYLICQAKNESWEGGSAAAYATTTDIADPASWSKLQPLGHRHAEGRRGLDFWVICDDTKAHLFFTTLNGKMWREETRLEDFPKGWSEPSLAIQGDIFEASHTYRLKGMGKYLTLVEAQHGHGWRYYKAYLADRLEGPWTPLAATKDKAFASMKNTRPVGKRWTDNISHGELLRDGHDQHLEVDPARLRLLIQGVLDRDRQGKSYVQIPWRLGMLEPPP